MEFNPSIKEASDFNGGKRYTNHVDSPSANDFNNLIEGFLKAQEDIDNANQGLEFVSGEVDEISVEVDSLGGRVPKIEDRLSLTEKRVDNLYARTFPDIDVIDNAVAYSKTVPEGVLPYAEVAKVGGMSYKSANRIPYPYAETTKTANGITFTDNGDGSITINGTCTEGISFTFGRFQVTPRQDYFLKVIPISGGFDSIYAYIYTGDGADEAYDLGDGAKFTPNGAYAFSTMVVRPGQTFDNLVIRPMLNEGSTALPYSPYFEGLRHAKGTAIKSIGANLFDISKLVNTTGIEVRDDKIIVTSPSNDSSVSSTVLLKDVAPWLKVGDVATLNAVTQGEPYIWLSGVWSFGTAKTITDDMLNSVVYFYVSGVNTSATISEIMLNIGDTALPYVPYREANYLPIPAAVQDLPDYGKTDTYIEWRSDGRFWVTPEGETNISHLLPEDNFIPVEGGGQIVAENEYELAVPTTINYQIN